MYWLTRSWMTSHAEMTTITVMNAVSGTNVADFDLGASYTWTIATAANGITGDVSNITIDRSAFSNATDGTFSLSISGNNLDLSFTPVPEPSTYALLALGLGVIGLAVRRRHRA